MADAIGGMLEGLAGAADIACSGLGLNDFDQAMDYQNSLIEQGSMMTRDAIDAQTSIMQSEMDKNRLNQTMLYGYGYGGGGSSNGAMVACVILGIVYVISMIVILMLALI